LSGGNTPHENVPHENAPHENAPHQVKLPNQHPA
jgi:hypothetical protein